MRRLISILAILPLGAPVAHAADQPRLEPGEVIAAADFEGDDPLRVFSRRVGAVELDAGHESRHAVALTARSGGQPPRPRGTIIRSVTQCGRQGDHHG